MPGKRLVCDALIIGGGPVGGTLACALAHWGLKVVIVDRLDPKVAMKAGFDGRTSAISHGSHNIFKSIGLWALLEKHAEPILDIKVSDHHTPWFIHYDHKMLGKGPMGFILENHRLRGALYQFSVSLKNLNWIAPAEIKNLTFSESGVEAILSTGQEVAAHLCLAADGRNSATRMQVEIPTTQWRYEQTAIVCVAEHTLPHNGLAHEAFHPDGPFAALPMQGNRSSIVWTEPPERAMQFSNLSEAAFNQEMMRRFDGSLGAMNVIGKRWHYPLGVQFAHRYIDRRLALVGDAAHSIHPIAGQGLNMGLRDLAALAEVLVDAHRLGLDIGTRTVLEKYQQWRRFDNMTLIAMTDGLNRLFSNRFPPLRILRDAGLATIQRVPPLKRYFMRHAMGVVGDLPRLVKGQTL